MGQERLRLLQLKRRLSLRRTLFVLPNMVTLASVFCGVSAIREVAQSDATPDVFRRAGVLLIFAMFFDLLDGRVARLTKTQSAFGLQLDSLADIVSFGVAPALLIHQWVLHQYGGLGLFVAFLFVACGAVRLARFNVLASLPSGKPAKPGKYILGLPIPPAAGCLISLVVTDDATQGQLSSPSHSGLVLVITVFVSLLMVSTIPFRSFKDLRLNTGTILLVLLAVGGSAFVWHRFSPALVLSWLLGVYVTIGFIEALRLLAQRLRHNTTTEAPHPSVPPPSP